jgi:hypothetical protein
MKRNACLPALVALLAAAPLTFAYEYPLSSTTIREAYLLGTATNDASETFLAQYTHTLPNLNVGTYMSTVKIETPYVQIAEHARQTVNYSAQGALGDFVSRPPSIFRMQLDICFGRKESQSVTFMVTQNDKKLAPLSVERSPYFAGGKHGPSQVIGEHVKVEFEADKIESTPLTVELELSDGRHAETTFDLARLK